MASIRPTQRTRFRSRILSPSAPENRSGSIPFGITLKQLKDPNALRSLSYSFIEPVKRHAACPMIFFIEPSWPLQRNSLLTIRSPETIHLPTVLIYSAVEDDIFLKMPPLTPVLLMLSDSLYSTKMVETTNGQFAYRI